jgi:hypothetical protein
MTSATEFALKADARWVEWGVAVPWRAAFWVGVVVVVTELPSAVINPATNGIDKTCWVESVDELGKCEFWIVGADLAPAFVVDCLQHTNPLAARSAIMCDLKSRRGGTAVWT